MSASVMASLYTRRGDQADDTAIPPADLPRPARIGVHLRPGDRITSAGGLGYTDNANGNVSLRGQTDAFEYDQVNRLTAVKHPTTGAVKSSCAYAGWATA